MSNRTTVIGGIWAGGSGNTPTGEAPVEGTTYSRSDVSVGELAAGIPYHLPVESDKLNEVLRRLTTLMSLLESTGVLPWCLTTSYVQGAIAMADDGLLYRSEIDSNVNNPPPTSTTQWKLLVNAVTPSPLPPSGSFVTTTWDITALLKADPAAEFYSTDKTWDLSGNIPSNATSVTILIQFSMTEFCSYTNMVVAMQQFGGSQETTILAIYTLSTASNQIAVAISSNRKLQFRCVNLPHTYHPYSMRLTLVGYN